MTTMAGEEWVKSGETIIEFDMENPHKQNTNVFQKYESVKEAKTVAEAKEKGAKAWDLVDWYKRGSLKVLVKVEPKGKGGFWRW